MGFSKDQQAPSTGTIVAIIVTALIVALLSIFLVLGAGLFFVRSSQVEMQRVVVAEQRARAEAQRAHAMAAEQEAAASRDLAMTPRESEFAVLIDAEGKLTVENKDVDLKELERLLTERKRKAEGSFTVHLQASTDCPVKHLATVSELCQKLEIEKFRISTH